MKMKFQAERYELLKDECLNDLRAEASRLKRENYDLEQLKTFYEARIEQEKKRLEHV